ncbi:MAG: hypothetical protein MRJ66_14245 [Nitrospira sp.]|nr:hypothetical protein [Nitrospira sp.]
MILIVTIAFWFGYGVAPVQATQADAFDPDQPFEQMLGTGILRSLFNQALDRLDEHVEISGNLNPNKTNGDEGKHLRFKFYPEGKSMSDQHFTAEGWFRSSPESGQHDWHFKFKRPEERPQKLLPQLKSPL